MAKREVMGRMICPECGHDAAEIKAQKCGVKLYRYCPECNAQFFARTAAQEAGMRKHLKPAEPAPAAVAAPSQAPAAEKKPEPAPAPAVKKPSPMGSALSFLGVNS